VLTEQGKAMEKNSLDRIVITNLRTRCVVGIQDWEKGLKQDVAITVTLHLDLSRAGKSDDVADTVDYKKLKKQILAHVDVTSFGLIERMAAEIAEICLESPQVERVDVVVNKLRALRYADSVAVEISRSR
jgi:FolB domain-containing protein